MTKLYPKQLDDVLVKGYREELYLYGFDDSKKYLNKIFFIPSLLEWKNNISNVYIEINNIEQFGYRLNPPNKYQLQWLKERYKEIDTTYIPYKCELISSWYFGYFNIYFKDHKYIDLDSEVDSIYWSRNIDYKGLEPFIHKGFREEVEYIYPEYDYLINNEKNKFNIFCLHYGNRCVIPSKNEWKNNNNNTINYNNSNYIKGIEKFNPRVAPPTEEQLIWLKEKYKEKGYASNYNVQLIESFYYGTYENPYINLSNLFCSSLYQYKEDFS